MKTYRKICAIIICGIASLSCGSSEIPLESRKGLRKPKDGNADLRLPLNRGSKPESGSRWLERNRTTYPNPGYYSSERR